MPITDLLEQVFDLCVPDPRSNLVFASNRTGFEVSGWTQLVAKLRRASGVEFDLHDLRRTVRTGFSRLEIPAEIAEIALGHAREELEGIYNRDSAIPQLRDAFQKWADHVSTLVAAKSN